MALLGQTMRAARTANRVKQMIGRARARVLGGDTQVAGKLMRIFEPGAEVVRKGKASQPTEFGK
ncbi:MAG: hypothetical protein ABSE35_02060 [Bryobacteraceae bacterium]|jgi:IS5 family transposase